MSNGKFRTVLVLLLALSVVLAIGFGATSTDDANILWQLRFPRVIMAFAIGAGLSVAGASLQALFSNPLCDPYTFGVSSGAALGAALGMTLLQRFGFSASPLGVTIFSLAGAGAFTLLLLGWARRVGARTYPLLIAGVALSFLGSSGIAVWMALSDPNGIQGALFWLLGDLSRSSMAVSVFTVVLVTLISFFLYGRRRNLDAFLLGDERAFTLGVSIQKERIWILAMLSTLIAVCVSAAGMIGFVGLAVPHFVRLLRGSLHRHVIPGSFFLGGATLVISDLIARTVVRPIELPVGVITAFWGAPVLLWILSRRGQGMR